MSTVFALLSNAAQAASAVNGKDPLAQMHDIVEPALLSAWWPLSQAWWLTLISALTLLTFIGLSLYKRWQNLAYCRQTRTELSRFKQQQLPDEAWAQGYLKLLKRSAKAANINPGELNKSGPGWLLALNKSASHRPMYFTATLSQALYDALLAQQALSQEQRHQALLAFDDWLDDHHRCRFSPKRLWQTLRPAPGSHTEATENV